MNAKTPLKLKINLENMPHSVFRRILVPENVNMMQMHIIAQLAMGWEQSHLFQFQDKKNDPTVIASFAQEDHPDFPFFGGRVKETKADEVELKTEFLVWREGKPFWYWYDFGDDWWHKITFQKPTKKDLELFTGAPVCVEAYGACPPEDAGGPWGYANFLDIIYNKNHPEYRETREWIGLSSRDKYDTEYVDVDFVNEQLTDFYRSKEWNIKADLY